MASATSTALRALASSPTLADRRHTSRPPVATATPHSISLPTLPPPLHVSSPVRHPQGRESLKSSFYCNKTLASHRHIFKQLKIRGHNSARHVVAMATGETQVEVATELPEIVTNLQEAWDRLEDKYAVTSLAIATLIALYGSVGLISAIDKLPLFPSLFELIGIGYTGWFAYRNLVFKPDREALIAKVKNIYSDVIGSN